MDLDKISLANCTTRVVKPVVKGKFLSFSLDDNRTVGMHKLIKATLVNENDNKNESSDISYTLKTGGNIMYKSSSASHIAYKCTKRANSNKFFDLHLPSCIVNLQFCASELEVQITDDTNYVLYITVAKLVFDDEVKNGTHLTINSPVTVVHEDKSVLISDYTFTPANSKCKVKKVHFITDSKLKTIDGVDADYYLTNENTYTVEYNDTNISDYQREVIVTADNVNVQPVWELDTLYVYSSGMGIVKHHIYDNSLVL